VLLLALLISHDVEAQRLVLILLLVKCSEQIQMVHWLVVFDGLLRAKVHKHRLVSFDQLVQVIARNHLEVRLGHVFNHIVNVSCCFLRILACEINFKATKLSTADDDWHRQLISFDSLQGELRILFNVDGCKANFGQVELFRETEHILNEFECSHRIGRLIVMEVHNKEIMCLHQLLGHFIH